MRVSDLMIMDISRRGLGSARERVNHAQEVALTGLRAKVASDDPIASASARRAQERAARYEAMVRNSREVQGGLEIIDSALGQTSELVSRVAELTLQAANDTYSAADRAATGREIEGVRAALLSLSATTRNGRYVFAGYREDQAPFDNEGEFTGDRNVREVEISPGLRVPSGLPGGSPFAPEDGVDMFALLDEMSTALSTNDTATIRTLVSTLDQLSAQITTARGQVGTQLAVAQQAETFVADLVQREKDDRTSLIEADQFDAYAGLTQAQAALEKAVTIAAQLPLPDLVSASRG